jgi:hypothetical protein
MTDKSKDMVPSNSVIQEREAYQARNIPLEYSDTGRTECTLVSQEELDMAARLRVEATPVRKIAQRMNITPGLVEAMITKRMDQVEIMDNNDIRKLELAKYDYMERVALEILCLNQGTMASDNWAQRRALEAMDRLIKISAEKRKMLGVDLQSNTVAVTAPVNVNINGVDVSAL